MAMAKGSRKAIRPKKTMEQRVVANLNPQLTDPRAQSQYDLATFRSARKNQPEARAKGKGKPIGH